MRTQAEWEEHHQLMRAANALADFARLESEDDVKPFRDDHSDFVPANWWVKSNWIRERNRLREAWTAAFPADLALKLTTSSLFGEAHLLAAAGFPAEKSNPIAVQVIRDVLDNFAGRALVGLPPSQRILAPDGSDITAEVKKRADSDPQIWPYQRAVLFLHIHPKQARICRQCHKPFVSESSSAQRCLYPIEAEDSEDGLETTCVRIYRKHYKHENWGDNRDRTNKRRRRKYRLEKKRKSSPRLTGSQRKKVAAKN